MSRVVRLVSRLMVQRSLLSIPCSRCLPWSTTEPDDDDNVHATFLADQPATALTDFETAFDSLWRVRIGEAVTTFDELKPFTRATFTRVLLTLFRFFFRIVSSLMLWSPSLVFIRVALVLRSPLMARLYFCADYCKGLWMAPLLLLAGFGMIAQLLAVLLKLYTVYKPCTITRGIVF